MLAVLLAVVTLGLYAQVSLFEFINFDDRDYVFNNENVLSGLTLENITWAFTLHGPGQWHPLTWLSHQLDCQLFGTDAGWHHTVNALFHIASAVLLFQLLVKMTSAVAPSFLVAALFAWHPLSVESVAWVSERRDVLSTFFWILTLHAYLSYARHGGWRAYGLVVVLFACGLMSKPMVVTLPCAMLLLDAWPLGRWKRCSQLDPAIPQRSLGELVKEKIPLLGLSLVASLFTFLIQVQEQAVGSLDAYPITSRVGNALVSYAGYLKKLVWPSDLAFYYPYPDTQQVTTVAISALVVLVITAIGIWQIRRRPHLLVGWLWYLGTLVPVIGLMQVGGQAMADRYTYLPLIGIHMAVAWSLHEFIQWLQPGNRGRQRMLQYCSAAILLLPCIVVSYRQIGYWEVGVSLYQRALEVTEDNSRAHGMLAADYFQLGEYDKSLQHFQETMRIDPTLIQPYMGMANIAEQQKDPARALKFLREAQHRNQHPLMEPIIARKLAWLLAAAPQEDLRDGPEALKLAIRCVELTEGRDPYCLHTLAVALAENQKFDEAITVARNAAILARQLGGPELIDQLNASLRGYQQKQAFRDPNW
jgi:hypothetical protein